MHIASKLSQCVHPSVGFTHGRLGVSARPIFHRQNHRPLQTVISELQFSQGEEWSIYKVLLRCQSSTWSLTIAYFADLYDAIRSTAVWIQNRGFKTLRTKSSRMESGYEGLGEPDGHTPTFLKVSPAMCPSTGRITSLQTPSGQASSQSNLCISFELILNTLVLWT